MHLWVNCWTLTKQQYPQKVEVPLLKAAAGYEDGQKISLQGAYFEIFSALIMRAD
jgi:hypothetical protein